MTGHEIYNEGYEAGYEAAMAEFLEYGPATEDILDGFANFGSGFSKLFRGVRIRSISVQNMIRNGMSEKEAVSRMKELVAYLRRSELLKEDIDPSVINKNFVLEKSDLTPTGRKYMDSITDALHDKRTMDSVANKIVHNAKKKRSDIDDDFHTTFLYIPMAAECIAWAPVTCGATLLAGALTAVVCEGIRALIKGIFNTDSSYSIASIIEDKVDMRKLKRGTRYAEESADLFDFDNLDEYDDAMEGNSCFKPKTPANKGTTCKSNNKPNNLNNKKVNGASKNISGERFKTQEEFDRFMLSDEQLFR